MGMPSHYLGERGAGENLFLFVQNTCRLNASSLPVPEKSAFLRQGRKQEWQFPEAGDVILGKSCWPGGGQYPLCVFAPHREARKRNRIQCVHSEH